MASYPTSSTWGTMFYTSSPKEKKETIKGKGVASFVRKAEYQRAERERKRERLRIMLP